MKLIIALCLFGLAFSANPICQLKPDSGPCRAYFPMYYYDSDSGKCSKFIYGGCQGNDNRFATEEECMSTCAVEKTNVAICHLEPETGMCLAYMPRYYYNAKERRCKEFIYGGCQGNPNNFKTLEECEERCGVESADVADCESKPERGLCLAYVPRYYYDKETGQCLPFIYGGCGGNNNNYKTEEECLQKCAALSEASICEQDAEPGRCLARFPRFYYNKHTGQCEPFIYGGCGGNENNFLTKEECEGECQVNKAEDVCQLDAETGPCRAYFLRYYFNKGSGQCEKFVYGGCDGNGNNFHTKEECEEKCPAY